MSEFIAHAAWETLSEGKKTERKELKKQKQKKKKNRKKDLIKKDETRDGGKKW